MRKAIVGALVALLALAGCSGSPAPSGSPATAASGSPATAASPRPAASSGTCAQLRLPFSTTVPIDTIVSTTVDEGETAGLRPTPPDASGHAGKAVANLPAGTRVTVCGKYVRPSDGKVTWKGVVLEDPNDPKISWFGPVQSTGWVGAGKLKSTS